MFCSQLLLGDAEAVLVLDPGVDLAGWSQSWGNFSHLFLTEEDDQLGVAHHVRLVINNEFVDQVAVVLVHVAHAYAQLLQQRRDLLDLWLEVGAVAALRLFSGVPMRRRTWPAKTWARCRPSLRSSRPWAPRLLRGRKRGRGVPGMPDIFSFVIISESWPTIRIIHMHPSLCLTLIFLTSFLALFFLTRLNSAILNHWFDPKS